MSSSLEPASAGHTYAWDDFETGERVFLAQTGARGTVKGYTLGGKVIVEFVDVTGGGVPIDSHKLIREHPLDDGWISGTSGGSE